MVKSKEYTLKPISKQEFDKLNPRLTIYSDIVAEFLKSNDDIMEVILPNTNPRSAYTSLKGHSQRNNYAFLVRRRERRIFLLKVKKGEEKP